jgi:DNA-binding transcriptional ArsR family regulator
MARYTTPPLPEIVDPAAINATRSGLPAPDVLAEATEVFRLLANRVRLSLMHALAHHELTVGDAARALDLSLSATSHQLAALRRMRLVATRDDGRLTYYRATDAFVSHLVHDCLAHAGQQLGRGSRPHHHAHRVPTRGVSTRKQPRPGKALAAGGNKAKEKKR